MRLSFYGAPFPQVSIDKTRRNIEPLASLYAQQEVVQSDQKIEELLYEIHQDLCSFEKSMEITEALEMVDSIVQLGIQRYFQPHINRILETTYIQWNEKIGFHDPELTVLAFRLLRLHGYKVSTDVIENLKDENGVFPCFSTQTSQKISGMINLYKCSEIGFPVESKSMSQVKYFAEFQLKLLLAETSPCFMHSNNNISEKVRLALEYPRRCIFDRLESRAMVRYFWPSMGWKRKCLELAMLDMAKLQSAHQKEINHLKKWWNDQDVTELVFARGRTMEIYFATCVGIFEPEFARFREAISKIASLLVVVDDLFDSRASDFNGLSLFAMAIERWDASYLEDLPEYRIIFTKLKQCTEEIAAASSNAQGQYLLPFFKSLWRDQVAAVKKEAQWREERCIPTFDEYMKVATTSMGLTCIVWTSLYMMGEPITDKVVQHIGKDSHFLYLVNFISRLANDKVSFTREVEQGEVANAINCYMKDHPGCTEVVANVSLECMIESACEELELEVFNSRGVVPECCSRALHNSARTDLFTHSFGEDLEWLFKDYFYGSLP